jgi:hypothetical protein
MALAAILVSSLFSGQILSSMQLQKLAISFDENCSVYKPS